MISRSVVSTLKAMRQPAVLSEMKWEKAGIEEYDGRKESAERAPRSSRRMWREAEPVRAELFQGKTRRDRDRGYGGMQGDEHGEELCE